mmetsp:Transcript_37851/g.65410  ORF Transcript_37851/g.65410 Transcript_37851/m.65410 type:complete len:784 (-) Transcript_37851:320-2671(-)|eukprot:CAMPEP_0184988690 /NCGR_PEP_ID=MMETSP1098-20130426/25173_1 /TAXON_ID=89044 /ORGANISM="Spumella elongata, Strain CCAP 955/1" /LENGTH=783 /DNA_ID=CAMNT_0027513507 /DNA_START=101 /DNA_END=2452 /DNA_ORIENTATION=+
MEQISEDGTNSVASSGQVNMEMSIIEELDFRFGAAKNKHQILSALEHCAVLHRIPLCNPNTTSEQARKDFRRERVLLNDVPFIPDNIDEDRCHAFDKTLNVLVERMARRKELYDTELYSTTEAITDAVLQRACRTGAGADSFFAVQKLLCVEGTFVTQRTYVSDPPIRIDVFVADPEVEGEYMTSSRKVPSRSESSSLSGIAMDRETRDRDREAREMDGQRTPPATPPVGKSKRTMPSPLKISLKNLGFTGSSSGHLKPSKHSGRSNVTSASASTEHAACVGPASDTSLVGAGCGVGCGGTGTTVSSGAVSGNFTPPATPSTSGVGRSFSSSSSAGIEDFPGLAISRDASLNNNQALNAHNNTGAICCRIQVMNSFAIYDVAAIEEITGVASQDPDPWLEVEAIVVDESNFKTDKHWRKLQLIATCPATGKVYTSNHDASSSSRHSGRLSGRMILQELTSWLTSFPSHHHLVPHLHHHHHHSHKNKHHHRNGAVNNHPNQSASVSHTNSADDTNVTSVHQIVVTSFTLERVSPHPSDGPSSSDLSTPVPLDNSFVSGSSSAACTPHDESGSDYSPINVYPSSGASRKDIGAKKTTSFSAADTRRQLSLHAVALAALQQDQDTPNSARDEYCYSAPHSLKYSAVPSPASTLQGLQVNSFDTTELAELSASRGRMLSIDEGEGGERHTDNTDRGSSEMHSSYSSLPLRTHDDLNMLIPALRQLPGRSGFSSETSSDPEGGAHVYNNSGESSIENSFSRSTFNSKDVYLSSSITSSVGAETDGSFE